MPTARLDSGFDDLDTLMHTPTIDTPVETVVVINGRVCVAYGTVKANTAGRFIFQAPEFQVPIAAVTVVEGDGMFWDAGANLFTNVATGNIKCGYFLEPATATDGVAAAKLDNLLNV